MDIGGQEDIDGVSEDLRDRRRGHACTEVEGGAGMTEDMGPVILCFGPGPLFDGGDGRHDRFGLAGLSRDRADHIVFRVGVLGGFAVFFQKLLSPGVDRHIAVFGCLRRLLYLVYDFGDPFLPHLLFLPLPVLWVIDLGQGLAHEDGIALEIDILPLEGQEFADPQSQIDVGGKDMAIPIAVFHLAVAVFFGTGGLDESFDVFLIKKLDFLAGLFPDCSHVEATWGSPFNRQSDETRGSQKNIWRAWLSPLGGNGLHRILVYLRDRSWPLAWVSAALITHLI